MNDNRKTKTGDTITFTGADLDAAVADGIVPAAFSDAFRDFMATRAAVADEERFRLLGGFNDVFVTISAVLVLVSVGWLAQTIGRPLVPVAVATTTWALAEYFVRRRWMALPGIVLSMTFASTTFWLAAIFVGAVLGLSDGHQHNLVMDYQWVFEISAGGATAAVSMYIFWRRFRVPIGVALCAIGVLAPILPPLIAWFGDTSSVWQAMVLIGGLTLFSVAMTWDIRDPTRTTRRSDVAFWLHMAAAPVIVHPAFWFLGLLQNSDSSMSNAILAIALYACLVLVALIVDRRALLVSGLGYLMFAISTLLRGAKAINLSLALTALAVGLLLLVLSAAWRSARTQVMRLVPGVLCRYLPT